MNVLKVLDRPIAFQRHFVTLTGSINAALMLSQAVYWSQRTTLDDGWFYKTQKDWMDETGLTRHEQDGARKLLKDKGLLEERLSGVPATVHFRVNAENLTIQIAENQQTSLPKTSKLDGGKPANKIAGKRQTITETTQETTSDISLPKDKPSVVESSLHTLFKEDFNKYYESKNGAPAPWDKKEAGRLSQWMKANPTITREQWLVILRNRYRSPVGHAKALSVWIGVAIGWLNGPADDWGKAITNGGANGSVPTGKADRNMEILQRSLARGKRQGGTNEDGVFPASGDGRTDTRKLHAGPEGS